MSDSPINGPCSSSIVNNVVGSINLCTGGSEYSSYGYNIRTWTAALFVALFALTSLAHLIQGIRSKRWWTLGTVFICAAVECLGWSGRLWSSVSTQWQPVFGGYWYSNPTAFLMQISTLIFAPAFLAAFWYILLGRLILLLGPQYCRFNPRTYAIVFCTGDLISLIVQAVGGGIASASDTLEGANNGAYIMVGGVFAQMFVMIVYCLLLAEFVVRYYKQTPVAQIRLRKTRPSLSVPAGSVPSHVEGKARVLVIAMCCSTLLVFIRSIYRCIELLNGWNGAIIQDQTLFDVLDGLMVFLATALFNVVHPLWYLPNKSETGAYEEKHSHPSSPHSEMQQV